MNEIHNKVMVQENKLINIENNLIHIKESIDSLKLIIDNQNNIIKKIEMEKISYESKIESLSKEVNTLNNTTNNLINNLETKMQEFIKSIDEKEKSFYEYKSDNDNRINLIEHQIAVFKNIFYFIVSVIFTGVTPVVFEFWLNK